MANEKLVVDTSVIVKWFKKDEEAANQAELIKVGFLQGDFEIYVPELVFYELGNVLLFHTNLSAEEASSRLQDFFSLGLLIKNLTSGLATDSLNIAFEYKVTFYDACFLATANSLKSDFITADKQLFNKVKELPNIQLLHNLT